MYLTLTVRYATLSVSPVRYAVYPWVATVTQGYVGKYVLHSQYVYPWVATVTQGYVGKYVLHSQYRRGSLQGGLCVYRRPYL
jgi:hypothetical protein